MSCWKKYIENTKVFICVFESQTNTSIPFLEQIIINSIDDNYHIGHLKPIYYNNGLPSPNWMCQTCKTLVR